MKRLVIYGGRPLIGTVSVSGSKKSILALLSAALLANEPCIIENVPKLKVVNDYLNTLHQLGVRSQYQDDSTLVIDPLHRSEKDVTLPQHVIRPSSVSLLGAFMGRYSECIVEKPSFSIDPYLKGFCALGANVEHRDPFLYVTAPKLTGNTIYLDSSDPTLTMNLILAAVRAEGTTVLRNASKDPEVVDLAMFVSAMGARIRGAGTNTIRIEGTNRSHFQGCRHTVIPDRIEAGMYMILAAATRGTIKIGQMIPHHVKPITAKLREMGVDISEGEETMTVSRQKDRLASIDIKTLPYPGFPIDLEQPFLTLLTQATGTSLVTSHLSSNPFPLVHLLKKMGANIKIVGQSIMVQGPTQLIGQELILDDPSSAAALLIAGLISPHPTTLIGMEALEKNYDRLLEKVRKLGAAFEVK